jgi:hypothetical protein
MSILIDKSTRVLVQGLVARRRRRLWRRLGRMNRPLMTAEKIAMGVRERILKLLKQQPFQPFRLVLSNGHTHDIRHPELAWVSPYFILVGIPDPDADAPNAIIDDIMVSMIHIVEVEPILKKTKSSK